MKKPKDVPMGSVHCLLGYWRTFLKLTRTRTPDPVSPGRCGPRWAPVHSLAHGHHTHRANGTRLGPTDPEVLTSRPAPSPSSKGSGPPGPVLGFSFGNDIVRNDAFETLCSKGGPPSFPGRRRPVSLSLGEAYRPLLSSPSSSGLCYFMDQGRPDHG